MKKEMGIKEPSEYNDESLAHSHFELKSWYGNLVSEQYKQQPKYCEPGPAGGGLQGEHSNSQKGP